MGENRILGFYKTALEGVRASEGFTVRPFDAGDGDFEAFLESKIGQSADSQTYRDVFELRAPSDAAASVYREYLDKRRARRAALLLADSASMTEIFLDQMPNGSIAKRPESLHAAWMKYLDLYMGTLEQLNAVVQKYSDGDASIDEVINEAGRSEYLARTVDKIMNSMRPGHPGSLEWQIINTVRARLNNFRVTVASITDTDRTAAEMALPLFLDSLKIIKDPFKWAGHVVREYLDFASANVEVVLPESFPEIRVERPQTIWEIFDHMAILAARRAKRSSQAALKFSWIPDSDALIVSSPYEDEAGLEDRWRRMDHLLHDLRGFRFMSAGAPGLGEINIATVRIPLPHNSGSTRISGAEPVRTFTVDSGKVTAAGLPLRGLNTFLGSPGIPVCQRLITVSPLNPLSLGNGSSHGRP